MKLPRGLCNTCRTLNRACRYANAAARPSATSRGQGLISDLVGSLKLPAITLKAVKTPTDNPVAWSSRVSDVFPWAKSTTRSGGPGMPAVPEEEQGKLEHDVPCEELRQALEGNQLGFGFSAGGLLFPYYIGVIHELDAMGIITRDTPLAGASAGSLIAACYHSGISTQQVIDSNLQLAEDCRRNGTRGRLGIVLQRFLEAQLPKDAHKLCSGRAYVAVTQAFPLPRAHLISEYHDRSDLIAALLTSCHIPWWFDLRLVRDFRGRYHYDGGLTNFIPLPPTQYGVRVCCFPAQQLNVMYSIGISPDTSKDFDVPMSRLLQWAFEPADDEIMQLLVGRGREDARQWARNSGLAGEEHHENEGERQQRHAQQCKDEERLMKQA